MNNELIEQTAEKRIEYLERSGILGKASQTMAAAYLLNTDCRQTFLCRTGRAAALWVHSSGTKTELEQHGVLARQNNEGLRT